MFLNDRHWFSSFLDETRVEHWPRASQIAFYCNVEARVWARVVITAPSDPHHRAWETLHVESSPRYRRGWGARNPASFFPGQPFTRYYNCFGYFPKSFWERELLITTLNLKGEYEHNDPAFRAICASVGL